MFVVFIENMITKNIILTCGEKWAINIEGFIVTIDVEHA